MPNISNPLLLEGLGALPYYPPPGQHSRQLQQLLRCSPADAAALAVRRPALLTKSPSALTASFRALSPWQLSQEQKSELLTAHPMLLRLAPTEVHLRCRWLRRVMLHSALLH
ncbi:MAG: hypothetical protein ACT6SB_16845, partial [Aeromicrobium sp.]|uniref:hypothetical protein n=1 Tax=Aeromicrobium sp. TaxID=1871063 RepID=UPI0040343433